MRGNEFALGRGGRYIQRFATIMKTTYPRTIDALPRIMRELGSYCRECRVADATEFVMTFAVEEVFTNMVKYNPAGPPEIELTADVKDGRLVIALVDDQEHEFDPIAAPDPDLQKKISERRPGGLGIYLVKAMVESVDYQRRGITNTITLSHSMEPGNVQRNS